MTREGKGSTRKNPGKQSGFLFFNNFRKKEGVIMCDNNLLTVVGAKSKGTTKKGDSESSDLPDLALCPDLDLEGISDINIASKSQRRRVLGQFFKEQKRRRQKNAEH